MMPILPAKLLPFIVEFQSLFSKSVWKNAETLLVGAILAIGRRTVTACLRVMGKSDDKHFQNYHRVLNQAQWSALAASRLLLRLLVSTFAPTVEHAIGGMKRYRILSDRLRVQSDATRFYVRWVFHWD